MKRFGLPPLAVTLLATALVGCSETPEGKFVDYIADGQYAKAYAMTSKAFKALTGERRFACALEKRGITGLSTAVAVALAVVSVQTPPPQAPVLIVMGASDDAARAMNASFVASVSADGRALVLRPVGAVQVAPDRALELWAVPPDGAPRSLGLVRADAATTLIRTQLLRDTAAFAVSVEPPGGSPTGAPTGPIVSVGKLEI